ncbi:MAG: alpha/beta hydrolase-fold protein [Candidatus Omnitrophica bacterium]|nr:alpha/beta hydrolase-fold protein [Candidatus Omnitrophota bacterium]
MVRIILSAFVIFCLCPFVPVECRTVDQEQYIVYVPEGYSQPDPRPLILVFSPGGDASGMITTWQPVADRYAWFVLASKQFRNNQDTAPIITELVEVVRKLPEQFPVDKTRVAASGFSGGAMFSHSLSFMYPDIISTVVANTGKIDDIYIQRKAEYPKNKRVVFLASPADFRYDEMKRDRQLLTSLGWKTKWIEFPDGHTIAPESSYMEAAAWLTEEWGE